MLLLQSVLALALVAAGLGVFLLLRWAERLATMAPASVHSFPPRTATPAPSAERAAA